MTPKTSEAKLLELIKKKTPSVKTARVTRLAAFYKRLSIVQRLNWLLAFAGSILFISGAVVLIFQPGYSRRQKSGPLFPVAEQKSGEKAATLNDFTRRNPFQPLIAPPPPPPKIVAPPEPVAPPPPKIPISQKASHLRIVGIINGTPLQAILEDQRRQSTLYVTAGQTIEDLEVDKVLSDRIILKSDGESLTLML